MWWAIAAAAIQAGSAIAQGIGQGAQAGELRRQAREQARRMRLEHAVTLGESDVAAGASGVDMGSESLTKIMADMTAEFKRQENWLIDTAGREASSMERSGLFQAFTGIGSSVTSYAANNNWFRTPSVR